MWLTGVVVFQMMNPIDELRDESMMSGKIFNFSVAPKKMARMQKSKR